MLCKTADIASAVEAGGTGGTLVSATKSPEYGGGGTASPTTCTGCSVATISGIYRSCAGAAATAVSCAGASSCACGGGFTSRLGECTTLSARPCLSPVSNMN